jgi:hypothetical protein
LINAETTGLATGASIRINNALNTRPALGASTNGSGNAGSFYSFGSGNAFDAGTQGTGGVARLHIDNPENARTVLDAITKGTYRVATFRIDNPLNSSEVLRLETNGSGLALAASADGGGTAGWFKTTGSGSAISAWSYGSGRALNAEVRGTGGAAFLKIDNPSNTDALINAETNGLGGGAGFRINNTQNSAPALYASTDGSGNAVHVNAYGSGNAIAAWSFGSGWAASFANEGSGNGIEVSVPQGKVGLSSNGSKNAVVGTSDGARLLYTEESTEVWFSDYGFGRLTNGSAFITIDPIFSETVNLDKPYHVFVQPYGDAELYVSQRTPAGFEVRLRAGDPGVEFSYRLVAVRRGYEDTRLERAPWADDDPNLYPAQPAAPGEGGAR